MTGAELVFDAQATRYNTAFSYTSVGRLQRRRVWKFLKSLSAKTHREVLELNCGTGVDAEWFAKKKFKITATDISTNMVREAEHRFEQKKLDGTFLRADIRGIKAAVGEKKFDVIFSDFGGFNCLSPEEIQKFAADAATMLDRGGRLVLVVMGRKCLWEHFYFRLKKQPEKANRRLSTKAEPANFDGNQMPVWYYSPEEIELIFAEKFRAVRLHPVGLFIPPGYLNNWFRGKKWLLEILEFFERCFGFPVTANYADHFYMEFVREQ